MLITLIFYLGELMAQTTKYNGILCKHSKLTEEIIGAFFTVYNALGCGFLEKVNANALNSNWKDVA